MKKRTFTLLLLISTALFYFVSCEEDFPKDEVIGDWQIDKFHYLNFEDSDTIFSSQTVYNLDSLTINDSTFDTLVTRYGWYNLSLFENLSVYSEKISGDSAYGYWERINDNDIRVWIDGNSLDLNKIDNDNYLFNHIFEEKTFRRIFWKRIK